MGKINIKDRIISKISSIDDEEFLREVESIILSMESTEYKPFILSDEMKRSVKSSMRDIQNGKVLSHEEVVKEAKSWLEKI